MTFVERKYAGKSHPHLPKKGLGSYNRLDEQEHLEDLLAELTEDEIEEMYMPSYDDVIVSAEPATTSLAAKLRAATNEANCRMYQDAVVGIKREMERISVRGGNRVSVEGYSNDVNKKLFEHFSDQIFGLTVTKSVTSTYDNPKFIISW